MLGHSVMSDSVTPWTVACQAPLSLEFSRQEYWSGLPFPSPGDLPDAGTEPRSPALQENSLPSETLHYLNNSVTNVFRHFFIGKYFFLGFMHSSELDRVYSPRIFKLTRCS